MSRKKLLTNCLNIAKSYITNNKKLETNKHFSFIIQNNAIISIGVNRRGRVHKRFGYNDFSNVHSEFDAYSKGKSFINNKKSWYVINIRLNNTLETMLAAPCKCCEPFLQILGCSKVIYSDFNETFNKIVL